MCTAPRDGAKSPGGTMSSNRTFATNKPRKGQRIIVHGTPIAGGITAPEGGTFATYRGTLNGSILLEGNTSDTTFADPSATWEPR